MENLIVFWFRRDLRLEDNCGLFNALQSAQNVMPVFIFDTNILEKLNKNDSRVDFIYQSLQKLNGELLKLNSSLKIEIGKPIEVWKKLISEFNITQVFTNHDYEKFALQRDDEVKKLLAENGIGFNTFKDQVIFEKREILNLQNNAYTVFTPYSRKWEEKITQNPIKIWNTEPFFSNFWKNKSIEFPTLESLGFGTSNQDFPKNTIPELILSQYANYRDFPAENGTSRLSLHLRFGTISIRKLVLAAMYHKKFLSELIWREFYMMLISNFPQLNDGQAFKPSYDRIPWRKNEEDFEKWTLGKTGYPIVDAGMRELKATGFMHNRVRMVVASFLCKHLLIDWRWGESYFAEKLLDFEFASNNGGWQWASGSGCDAAPYFRIFNPTTQAQKFDKDLVYIKKWIPELNEFDYPKPMIEHTFARERALKTYKSVLIG